MSGLKKGYHGSSCACACGRSARFVNWRPKRVLSLVGEMELNRAYYHCAACGCGLVPWDLHLAIGHRHLTPAAEEITTLAGTLDSFAQASERTLVKMAGLRLSESTVERTTEEAGLRLREARRKRVRLGRDRRWAWQRDARGRTCAYASLDATGVRRQGPHASRLEGRMAYNAMIYNPDSPHDPRRCLPHQVRYLAGFVGLDELGLQLRSQAAQVGWDEAEQQVALTDGGNGLEEFMHRNFPLAQCILDFYHASEHVANLARAMHPQNEEAFGQLTQQWCHLMKHEGGAALLRVWEELDLKPHGTMVCEVYRAETQYLRNNVHRMEYPTYLANGWQIGSGPVEAACKTVVGQRLKCSGMRWGDDGADALCHLRALYLSEPDQWDSFWSTQTRQTQPL